MAKSIGQGSIPNTRLAALRAFIVLWIALAAGLLATVSDTAAKPTQELAALSLVAHSGGAVRAVVTDGTLAWVGEGIGITILDVSDADGPRRLAHVVVGPGADVTSLARSGNHLFVGAVDGVHVLAEGPGPAALETVAHVRTPGRVTGLLAHGGTLIISDADYGVLIADISAHGDPRVKAGIALPGGASGPAAADGDVAIVPGAALYILRLTAPGEAVLSGQISTAGPVAGVAVNGHLAYAADGAGLLVADLTAAGRPSILTRLDGTPPGRLAALWPMLYILADSPRLVDTTNPAQPVDAFGGPGPYAELSGVTDLALDAGLMVAARGDSVDIVRIDDPLSPEIRGGTQSTWPVLGLAAGAGHALVAKGSAGLDVVALGVDRAETVVSYNPPGGVFGVALREGMAFLTTGLGGQAMDLSNPADPGPPATFGPDWPQTPWIDADGGFVVAVDPLGLHVATESGGAPTQRGSLEFDLLPDWPPAAVVQGIAQSGSTSYLAAGRDGVILISVDNPEAPRYVGRVLTEGEALSVAAAPGRVIAGLTDGYALFDTTVPRSPVLLVRRKLGWPVIAADIDITRDRAYLAAEAGGILGIGVAFGAGDVTVSAFVPGYAMTRVNVSEFGLVAAGAGVVALEETTAMPTATSGPPTAPPPVPSATATPLQSPSATASATAPTATTTREPTPTASLGHKLWLPSVRTTR